MQLNLVDWLFIIAYMVFSFGVGLYYSKRAGKSLSEFFVAGRNVSWFMAGTSLVATTFAADTPLVVCGLVRKGGIFENWLWWNAVLGTMMTVFFFARLWRRARILTDVEFIELRYTGKAASVLRGFNAVYLGLFANCITLGWVMLAMTKICDAMLGWDKFWSVAILSLVTLAYTVLSGYWGVIVTDVVQFFIKMFGVIMLAVIAVWTLGGPTDMIHKIVATPAYHPQVFSMVPNLATAGKLAVLTFVLQISLQWWGIGAGSGYVVQRFFSTRTEKDAVLSALWFNFAQYVIRSWPWILVGLASLVYFPLVAGQDNEIVYPKMIARLMPPGLRGLMTAAMFAAYMSTVTSMLNCGASYMVNDLYKRFIKKEASQSHYVGVARLFTVLILVGSAIAAWQSENIAHVWIYMMTLGAGCGFLMILRWFWWRVNPWSEISAMGGSIILANGNILCKPLASLGWISSQSMALIDKYYGPDYYAVRLAGILLICTVLWVVVTYLTKPAAREQLELFYRRVRPGGWWGPIAKNNPDIVPDDVKKAVVGWLSGVISTYTGLFGVGYLCLAKWGLGLTFTAVSLIFCWVTLSQVSSETIEEIDEESAIPSTLTGVADSEKV
jgi:SSS family solute:Na+ symporter